MGNMTTCLPVPKSYRFEGAEVRIHRDGDRVVLEPTNDSALLGAAAADAE